MNIKDVFITEKSKPVFVALADGGLYNFHIAPGARVSGVVVYTNSNQAAIAGLSENVPVSFVSKTHKSTRSCWTRIQPRPDKTWRRNMQGNIRFKALIPHWKEFQSRVRKDIGMVPSRNLISVSASGHYLIGPAPTRYEDRLPYVSFAGKPVQYLAADQVQFGTRSENSAYARNLFNQYYEAYMNAGKK